MTITKPAVEQTIFAWLESLGWTVKHGPGIVPGELLVRYAERLIGGIV
jgi:hypothetical protein